MGMVFFFWVLSQPSRIERLVQSAISIKNIEGLANELLSRPDELQGRALDQMMGRLYEESELILAIQLSECYLRQAGRASTAHRWIKRLLEQEPELCKAHYTPGFLEQEYNPNMAAHCAPGG